MPGAWVAQCGPLTFTCQSVCGETLPGVRAASSWFAHSYEGLALVRVCLLGMELMHPYELDTNCIVVRCTVIQHF